MPLQAVGSVIFIMMYYWRRVSWRFRNRKGKKRIARAAHDALALKKKNSDSGAYDLTASAGTSMTEKVGGRSSIAEPAPAWFACGSTNWPGLSYQLAALLGCLSPRHRASQSPPLWLGVAS